MTQGNNDTDTTKKRSIRWKERFSRTTRQSQHAEFGLEQKQLLPPSDTNSKPTSSDNASYMYNSDNMSIQSGSSNDIHGESDLNSSTMTKAQLTRNKDFHENFKQVPVDDILRHEFKCALQKDVLLQGRLYFTKNYVCFKSNILGYITTVELKIKDIKHLDRVRTLRFMPRVIQLTMNNDDKYIFTSFLASLSARDEAYNSLMDLWHHGHPPATPISVASSASSISSSTTTLPPILSPPLTSPEKLPPVLILPDSSNTDHHESDNIIAPTMVDIPSSSKGGESPSNSSHFKIFHRRRAQTVSAQNEQPYLNRERSITSSSTPLTKTTSGHISWLDDRKGNTQPEESKPISTSTRSSSKSSILKRQKIPPPSSTPQNRPTNVGQPLARTNATTLFAIGGFILLLSHLILTYEFYNVTQHFSIQQQEQQRSSSRGVPQGKQQLHDTAWISGQLQDVKTQAQLWEQETLRQRKKLLDLIPS